MVAIVDGGQEARKSAGFRGRRRRQISPVETGGGGRDRVIAVDDGEKREREAGKKMQIRHEKRTRWRSAGHRQISAVSGSHSQMARTRALARAGGDARSARRQARKVQSSNSLQDVACDRRWFAPSTTGGRLGGQHVFDVYSKTTERAPDGTSYSEW